MKRKKEEKPNRARKAVYPLSLILLLGVSAYVLAPGFQELDQVRAQVKELRRKEGERKSHNEALRKEIESMHTSEGIEWAARRYLRLAKPDEVVIVFRSPEDNKAEE